MVKIEEHIAEIKKTQEEIRNATSVYRVNDLHKKLRRLKKELREYNYWMGIYKNTKKGRAS